MDHYLAPEGTERIDVPYVGSEEYDGQDFFTYPDRKGWTRDELKGDQKFGNRSPEEAEAFFQTWLFFGGAISVFKIVDITLMPESFLRRTPKTQTYITTEVLRHAIQQWRDRADTSLEEDEGGSIAGSSVGSGPEQYTGTFSEGESEENDSNDGDKKEEDEGEEDSNDEDSIVEENEPALANQIRHEESIKLIIEEILYWARRYCGEENMDPDIPPSPIRPTIAMSIIALGSTLSSAATEIYSEHGVFRRYLTPHWPKSVFLKERMQRSEWCPRDISEFRSEADIDSDYYFGSILSPRKDQDHSQCTEGRCYGSNVRPGTYTTQHAIGCDHSCENVEAYGLVDIIGQGKLPLVHWNESEGALTVIEYQRGSDIYAAISHIWADGMGNETCNALPSCQLSRLQRNVTSIYPDGKGSVGLNRSVPFWIDTLCVPSRKGEEAYRKLAIQRMRNVYTDADGVLVFDAFMQKVSIKADITEKCVQLYLCSWRRRLWTLQEGRFARNLYFQLNGGSQSLEDFGNDWGKQMNSTVNMYSSITGNCYCLASAAFDFIPKEMDKASMVNSFFPLVAEVQNRSTTRSTDETICFATLLGIDPGPLMETKDQDRMMETFLQLVKEFQREIIFNDFPHLKTVGFQWAPQSFMDPSKQICPEGTIPTHDQPDWDAPEPTANLSLEGLNFCYPGILLESIGQPTGSEMTIVANPPRSVVKIWLPGDGATQWSDLDSSKPYAIIMYPYFRYAQPGEATAAILVLVTDTKTKHRIVADHISRLWVRTGVAFTNSQQPEDTRFGTWLEDDQKWLLR